MKVCPICGARAFDDARVCYGCLFRYDEEEGEGEGGERESVGCEGPQCTNAGCEALVRADAGNGVSRAQGESTEDEVPEGCGRRQSTGESKEAEALPAASLSEKRPHAASAPGFLIRFVPVSNDAGGVTWLCGVEME